MSPDDFVATIRAAREGEPRAWDDLFRRYSGPVAGYLRLQGARDVDDVASEVFLSVFRAIGTFVGDEAAFRSWLFVIAHRRLQDERRRAYRQPETEVLEGRGAAVAAAETEASARAGTERVLALCAQLPDDQRDVMLLRVVADLGLEATGQVLGKTTGAVKALQHRAHANLKKLLDFSESPVSP